jgi:hypothetical protein
VRWRAQHTLSITEKSRANAPLFNPKQTNIIPAMWKCQCSNVNWDDNKTCKSCGRDKDQAVDHSAKAPTSPWQFRVGLSFGEISLIGVGILFILILVVVLLQPKDKNYYSGKINWLEGQKRNSYSLMQDALKEGSIERASNFAQNAKGYEEKINEMKRLRDQAPE